MNMHSSVDSLNVIENDNCNHFIESEDILFLSI